MIWCIYPLVMATDEKCSDFQFKSPGESCEGIYNKNPESHTKPGYYWILSREMDCTGYLVRTFISQNTIVLMTNGTPLTNFGTLFLWLTRCQ